MAGKKGGNTVDAVWSLVKPIIEDLNLILWDVRFVKEGADWFLRIFIDKQDGVTIEDCEAVSRAVDVPLDELDPIEQNYCLEVSSPGLERTLVREEHFEQFIGENVLVKMIRPLEKWGKEFSGNLKDANKTQVTIINNGEEITVNKKDTVWVKLDDFNF